MHLTTHTVAHSRVFAGCRTTTLIRAQLWCLFRFCLSVGINGIFLLWENGWYNCHLLTWVCVFTVLFTVIELEHHTNILCNETASQLTSDSLVPGSRSNKRCCLLSRHIWIVCNADWHQSICLRPYIPILQLIDTLKSRFFCLYGQTIKTYLKFQKIKTNMLFFFYPC